VKLHIK
jgi:hypothetical protein